MKQIIINNDMKLICLMNFVFKHNTKYIRATEMMKYTIGNEHI
jgi:hypothetical protein